MSPALLDGDYVLIKKPRQFKAGFIYVINHSDLGVIIKRLSGQKDHRYLFEGDNPESTPGAVIAPVNAERIIGQVWLRISRNGIKLT